MKTKFASISRLAGVAVFVALICAVSAEGASLWTGTRSRETAMVSDRRARRVGDILTVVVQESASVSASRSTSTNKSASVDNAVDQFLFPLASSRLGSHNGALPGMSATGASTFEGGGEITNRQVVTARAAVSVIDVLPNGNLVIEGSRYVAYSGEKQYVVLHGIVRPDDVGSSNTVLSSAIADARVEFLAKGPVSSSERKGWFTRVLDTLNPF